MAANGTVRVVVTDDSALMRRFIGDALASAGFAVVGTARDGDEALAACRTLAPDVLTLDLAMPGLDGLGVLRALAEERSAVRVVVVSAFSPAAGARAVDALAMGAIELVAKPSAAEGHGRFLGEVAEKVRLAAAAQPRAAGAPPVHRAVRPGRSATRRAVVVATSTGGPRALAGLLPELPAPLGSGTLVVQHMPAGFTASLAQRLDRMSRLDVREAQGGETLDPRVALVAPGGSHLRLTADGKARLSEEDPIGGLRPRADLTIVDAAEAFGDRLLLVVLTGMGKDGLEGARAVKARGGRVLVEAESSCTVYGMPRAVVEARLADGVYDLSELPAAVAAEAGS
jgi:two-component system, chemotaxis family, protein-glutamate methylesterase/glutaminase